MVKMKLVSIFFIVILGLSFIFNNSLSAQELDFSLEDINGKTVSLSGYKGKNVVLYFWAIYCPHCTTYIKPLNEIYPKLQEDGVIFLSINIYESKTRNINFVKNKSIRYPILLDPGHLVADKFGIVGIPTFVLINKQGKIVSRPHHLPDDLLKIFNENA